MSSFWIIIEQGTEYNDSTYDIAGEAMVYGNGFPTKEDAMKAADERLKDRLSGFRLRDFDDYYGRFSSPGYDDAIDEFFGLNMIEATSYKGYDRTYWNGGWNLNWEDFISYCEEQGFKWRHLAPELITVQEVKVNE